MVGSRDTVPDPEGFRVWPSPLVERSDLFIVGVRSVLMMCRYQHGPVSRRERLTIGVATDPHIGWRC
ncbi:hypothetical protein C497_16277 [Halalkalicoccus jeotgali B3]|uniref:Uncharacterized protein n=1 Tax=Halalkalicoccus jeotgali (strain DSM 18796 / CECT 7217 / JCM 14584 / KCTC 4019 / B3) TaxID=795797 RepID=L9V9Q1_HALJB|nr:hypothetical protein C497_16277 [Halalkalicoccus jeotgali B3]